MNAPSVNLSRESSVAALTGLFVRLGHWFAKAQVEKRLRFAIQAGGTVPQSLAPSKLGKSHTDELLATPEMADLRLGILAFHQMGKRLAINQIQNLRKNVAAGIHAPEARAEPPQFSSA